MYDSCNRDEQKFPNAGRFDVGRENVARHLAFGQGIHFCPGAPLARLEFCIAFELLLTRLPGVRVNDILNHYRHLPSFTNRALKSMHLSFDHTAGM